MSAPDLRDRLRGAVVGVLVGDALGVPVEFSGRSMRDQDPVTDMRGFGTWNQPPGTWSDDSSMTLATADALATHGWDPRAMMDGYLAWLDQARWTAHGAVFDVGNATRNAIMLYRIHGDCHDCGQSDERDNGNGSLMRAQPVSCWLFGSGTEAMIRQAGEASALTHAHLRSRLCCAWHALWCDGLLGGQDVRSAALSASQRLRRHVPPEEREPLARLLDGSAMDLDRSAVIAGGYVVSTLEAALWSLAQHDGFADAVLAAVNLGGDTDTNAAVTGGMAGLRCGLSGIPPRWIAALARSQEVLEFASTFADACLDHWEEQP